MKSLFLASNLILISSLAAFAQTNENLPCPVTKVTNSLLGDAPFGETLLFTAKLSEEAEKYDLKYNWTTSNGTIIEGQGTSSIKILADILQNTYATTVEIVGLPKNCLNEFTKIVSLDRFGDPLTFDQFSISAPRINKFRLNKLLRDLQKKSCDAGIYN